MSVFVVEAMRTLCASFMIVTATVYEIFGGQTNVCIHVRLFKASKSHNYVSIALICRCVIRNCLRSRATYR